MADVPPAAPGALPAVGADAPDFTVLTDAGTPLTLSALRGRPVVLYFYPKDDTSGCTTEACEFRDAFPRFAAGEAAILGVSPDPPGKLKKFDDKYSLGFTLLSDADHSVAEAYGVWAEKNMYGKKHMGVQRSAFLIDETGKVANAWPKISPKDTPTKLLGAIGGFTGPATFA